jgi:hypothetical protein
LHLKIMHVLLEYTIYNLNVRLRPNGLAPLIRTT